MSAGVARPGEGGLWLLLHHLGRPGGLLLYHLTPGQFGMAGVAKAALPPAAPPDPWPAGEDRCGFFTPLLHHLTPGQLGGARCGQGCCFIHLPHHLTPGQLGRPGVAAAPPGPC